MYSISVSSSVSHDYLDLLLDGLTSYNANATGHHDGKDLVVSVQRDGKAVGGCYAWTWAGICNVVFLHIPEDTRRQGIGKAVMTALEAEARLRACHEIVLWTYSFQAPKFYEKLGFEITHTFNDHPPGHQQHFLRKRLAECSR